MADRPAVVLLHGFTGSGDSWRPVINGLAERYRPIAPDLRGHASASEDRPVTLEAVLDDIAALAPPRFTLAGYSQGGRIALHAALAFPERVTGLALIGASPGIADPQQRAARCASDEALADEFEQLTIGEIAERWAQTPVLGGVSAAQAEFAQAQRLRSTPAGLAAALRGLGTGALAPVWGRLREISVPTTLIVGARDEKFQAIAREMVTHLPQGRLVVVEGAGHAVQLEQPAAVSAAIDALVQRSVPLD